MKEIRLESERLNRRIARIGTLKEVLSAFRQSNMTPRDFFPTLDVITSVPHIGQVLDHGDKEAFEELKNGITEELPGIADQARRDREETLLKLLPPGYTSPEPLNLATTWFRCPIVHRAAARAEDVVNEIWTRKAWDIASLKGDIQWSSIVPRIALDKKVMAAVTKLITDLGVGDPEKMTAEDLDKVHCRVLIFWKGSRLSSLIMEVGSWRHLVRVSPLLGAHAFGMVQKSHSWWIGTKGSVWGSGND